MYKIFLTGFFLMLLGACSSAGKSEMKLPFFTDFKDSNGWSLDAGAKFDATVSAEPGSGSIRLAKAADNWMLCDRVTSDFKLPVKAGKTYTLSFKTKTDSFPPPLIEASGALYGEDGFIENSNGTMCANSQKGVWEENFVLIRIPRNDLIRYMKIKLLLMPKRSISAPVWIDDVKLVEGVHLPSRSPKKEFKGAITRVDKLGNIEIKKGDKFVPFFPIGIYTDENRADWRIYKKLGFNTNMWASNAYDIKKAKDAGLYSMLQIVQYIVPVDESWIPQDPQKKMAHLHKTLQKIETQGLGDMLLSYYVDNEFYHLKPEFTKIVDAIRKVDKNHRPIYMLSGAYGMARLYNKYIDFTGTYVAEDGYETPIVENLMVLNSTPNQTQPAVIGQINRGVGKSFRSIVYAAIAKGARGIGFWRDGGSAGKIESRPIAQELPKIAREIKTLMPLIRTKCETTWRASCDSDKVIFGTRTLKGEGYLIVANPTSKRREVSFSVSGMAYRAKKAEEYFSHQKIADVNNGKFRLKIDPYDAMVVKLVK
jgi:hypothetical protein